MGESILAAIVPAVGEPPTLDSLRAHLSTYVSPYKVPHHVVAVDAIPRNASGKVLKHVLREQLAESRARA